MTVADKGGLTDALKGKRGAIKGVANLGDAMIHISVNKEAKYPIEFKTVPIDRVYVDPNADVLRGKSGIQSADEVLIVYKFGYDQFLTDFSHFPNAIKAAVGNLPNTDHLVSLHEYSETESPKKNIEVGFYYRLSKKVYSIFAGSSATPLLEVQGEEYPFMKDGKPYVPLIPFRGWAKMKGYYSYGLGHLLIKEARQRRRAENWGEWGMMRNIKGLGIVRLPPGMSKAKFMSRYRLANEALKKGRDGMILVESNGINDSGMRIDKFATDPVTEEMERFRTSSDLRIKRIGIPLDEVDRPASESATQTLSEEQRADIFAQEFMRQNADSFQWMWELVIELMREFIPDDDDTPVDMSVEVPFGMEMAKAIGKEQGYTDEEIRELASKKVKPKITMGAVANALRNKHWFVEVDELSGVIKSNVREITEIKEAMAITQPGSPEFMALSQKLLRLYGQDLKLEKNLPPAQPVPPEAEGSLPGQKPSLPTGSSALNPALNAAV